MFAMVRPGPFICAEYELGGFPSWLLRDPNMKFRSNYKPYLDAVDRYFSKLLAILKNFQFSTNGGPIIGVQIENEFSSVGNVDTNPDDHKYLQSVTDMAIKYGMNSSLLYTSDPRATKTGTLPGGISATNYNNIN